MPLHGNPVYEKWINDLGFPPESILIAAGKIKGDLKKLDGVLLELCGAKAFTKKEIDEFFKQREELAVLARETCRSLSVYLDDLGHKLGVSDSDVADLILRHRTVCKHCNEVGNDARNFTCSFHIIIYVSQAQLFVDKGS